MTEAIRDTSLLIELIKCHDIIWCLTDNKESRWTPTVVGLCEKKIVVSVGLGVDQYVVTLSNGETLSSGGCFFCNDVVGPVNSIAGKSPEERCSIVRAGLSSISAGYAVEKVIEMLQPSAFGVSHPENIVSIIRGSLEEGRLICSHVEPYECCTACSYRVQEEYEKYGIFFLLKVCNCEDYLENLSGITDQMGFVSDKVLDDLDTSEEDC